MTNFDPKPLCGWLGADHTQRSLASRLPTLTQAAPYLFGGPSPTSPILLFKAWDQVLGGPPKTYVPQQIGDCVSFGHGHGNDLLQCIEISLGSPAVFQETDTEYLYGASREIAGILGRQDGSYGAAAVKAMQQWGMVSRAMLGSDGTYSGDRARQWGLDGIPDSVKQQAAPFKLGAAAAVTTWDELVAAFQNGYPVTECSNWLPDGQRDSQGFGGQNGRGGHCQCIIGLRFDRPGACIFNSWPPEFYSGPTDLGIPQVSQWVDQPVIERILGEGDSWALSKSPAFEVRPLPPSWTNTDWVG